MLDMGNNISQQNNVMLTKILNALTTQNLIIMLILRFLVSKSSGNTIMLLKKKTENYLKNKHEVMNAILAAINNLIQVFFLKKLLCYHWIRLILWVQITINY